MHPGTRKMVCTSLCEILTFSKNLQTNMFILIVGQLRYPEVLSTTLLVWPCLLSYHLGSYWVYCGMLPQVPGILLGVLWYVIPCTWDLIGCTMVCHHMYLGPYQMYHGISYHVPGTLLGVPWYTTTTGTWDFMGYTMVCHTMYPRNLLGVPWYATTGTWNIIGCTVVCHTMYLGPYWMYHGIPLQVPGILWGTPWYVTPCTWDLIGCAMVCCWVPGILSGVP